MNRTNAPIFLNHAGICCALGNSIDDVESALFAEGISSPLRKSDQYSPGTIQPLGQIHSEFQTIDIADENSRNNRILAQALRPLRDEIEQLKSRYGSDRIGVIIGTSTSGVAEGETAMQHIDGEFQLAAGYRYRTQELSAPSRFAARWLGLNGPTWSVSSACTSGGKALASAARLLKTGAVDAVIAGGVDSLCKMTVNGFGSLAVTSTELCLPFSQNRRGVNIGEGAAVFIVSHETGPVCLAACGETSDAHHISSPEPEGRGAEAAMRQALAAASLTPADIAYINLHGTATRQNDLMESLAIHRVFGEDVACSSTKPLTGHTLAAAGAIEAAFCWLTLKRKDGRLPPHLWDGVRDPDICGMQGLGHQQLTTQPKAVMSNSFAFGGNNLSLIMTGEPRD